MPSRRAFRPGFDSLEGRTVPSAVPVAPVAIDLGSLQTGVHDAARASLEGHTLEIHLGNGEHGATIAVDDPRYARDIILLEGKATLTVPIDDAGHADTEVPAGEYTLKIIDPATHQTVASQKVTVPEGAEQGEAHGLKEAIDEALREIDKEREEHLAEGKEHPEQEQPHEEPEAHAHEPHRNNHTGHDHAHTHHHAGEEEEDREEHHADSEDSESDAESAQGNTEEGSGHVGQSEAGHSDVPARHDDSAAGGKSGENVKEGQKTGETDSGHADDTPRQAHAVGGATEAVKTPKESEQKAAKPISPSAAIVAVFGPLTAAYLGLRRRERRRTDETMTETTKA